MPSSQLIAEPSRNPLAPVMELVGWLTSPTLHIAIGVLAGLIATNLMRRHHLRWTWAGSVLALVVLDYSAFEGWGTTLGATALCAAMRGRHLHREDLQAGGDLAEIASARRGPFAVLCVLSQRLRQHLGSSPTRPALRDERMIVGRAAGGEVVSI